MIHPIKPYTPNSSAILLLRLPLIIACTSFPIALIPPPISIYQLGSNSPIPMPTETETETSTETETKNRSRNKKPKPKPKRKTETNSKPPESKKKHCLHKGGATMYYFLCANPNAKPTVRHHATKARSRKRRHRRLRRTHDTKGI